MSNEDLEKNAEMNQAMDAFLPSDGFPYWDPNFIAISNFKFTKDNSKMPSGRYQEKPALEQLYMPSLNSTPRAEVYQEPKSSAEGLMLPPQIVKRPSIIKSSRYGESIFAEALGESSLVMSDCYSPGRPCYTRTLSGRSVHSSIAASPTDDNSVMRQNSVNSTTSQDSRYSTLKRGLSTYRRETRLQGTFRRDSTNSAASQESRQGIHEREYRQDSRLYGLRNCDFPDMARRSSAYDVEAFPTRGEGDSDDIPKISARGGKFQSFRCRGSLLLVQRDTQSASDCMHQDQSLDQLAALFGFTHI